VTGPGRHTQTDRETSATETHAQARSRGTYALVLERLLTRSLLQPHVVCDTRDRTVSFQARSSGFGDKVFASRDRTVLFSIGCWQHKQLSHTNQKFMNGKKVDGFSADRRWEE